MVNENSRQAIAIVKARQQIKNGTQNVAQISKNITASMQDINLTQKKFQLRRAIEEYPIAAKAYSVACYLKCDFVPTWDVLFREQLDNVGSLNESLIGIICNSSEHLKQKQTQLLEGIDVAKLNFIKYRGSQDALVGLKKDYESMELFTTPFDPNVEDHYDLLKKQLVAEDKVVSTVGEITLREEVHSKDLDKIRFLERHIAFYRGVIFSAKRLAQATNQICGALDQLVDIYQGIDITRDCLIKVHKGVGLLRGHTDDLKRLYQSTNEVINVLGTNNECDILRIGAQNLDGIVCQTYDRMIPNES